MIVIIDYGVGNLASVSNMFKKIGVKDVVVSGKEEIISKADKILLPGVGAFDAGMGNLEASGLIPLLNKKALEEKVPVLGICLGMQMLGNGSEEGKKRGLGWIDSFSHKFNFNENEDRLTVPHMGWNFIHIEKQHSIVENLPEKPRYYFVHSYYVKCKNTEDILLTSNYGIDFTCGVQNNNIIGFQFHPEKSHKYGFQLLKNFSDI